MRARSLLTAPLLLTLAGCQSTTITTGLPPQRGTVRQMTVMGYASGLIMPSPHRLARSCPMGVSFLRTEQTPRDFAVQTVTAGILSPRTVTVMCADPRRLELIVERRVGPFPPRADRVGPMQERHHGSRAELLDLHPDGRDYPRHRHRRHFH